MTGPNDDTDDEITIPRADYDALLRLHPWIRSRDEFAYLSRGWRGIVADTLGAMDVVVAGIAVDHPDVTVENWSSKEKFGELRIHFDLRGAPPAVWPILRGPVDEAGRRSLHACERCGAPGSLRSVRAWHSVRCDAHGREESEAGR